MKSKNQKSWVTAVGAGLFASFALLPQAKGELVYESDAVAPTHSAQIEERSTMREVIGSSEKAQVTQMAAAPEMQNFSKSELMRRERQREELKNEDLLQTRLEELRLRDERRRSGEVLGAEGSMGPIAAPAAAPAPVAVAVMREEFVSSAAPVGRMGVTGGSGSSDSMTMSSSMSVSSATAESSEKTMISVVPRFGFANVVNNGGLFEVRPRFAGGIGAAISTSDNLSFELGYQYGEYGVAMASTNPFVSYAAALGNMGNYNSTSSMENVVMKQNVVDAGIKLHFLGPEARLRPFIGGGGAYSKSFINYDSRVLTALNQLGYRNMGTDYDVTQFLGYLSTGADVRVAKSISVGASFKYYAVLSSRENTAINNYAMYGNGMYPQYNQYQPYYGSSAYTQDSDKQAAGGSLASSAFYSIMGNVTFTF